MAQKATIKKEDVVSFIENMTVLELSEFVKELEDKFGVTAAAPMMAAVAAGPTVEEEKTEFDVILKGIGPNKIAVIKEVKALTGLGLKEAKAVVDSAPSPVKEKVNKAEAEEIKTKLEATGAEVEVK